MCGAHISSLQRSLFLPWVSISTLLCFSMELSGLRRAVAPEARSLPVSWLEGDGADDDGAAAVSVQVVSMGILDSLKYLDKSRFRK
jgi:hypothetical protein